MRSYDVCADRHDATRVDVTELQRIRHRTSPWSHQHFKMASQRHLRRLCLRGHATNYDGEEWAAWHDVCTIWFCPLIYRLRQFGSYGTGKGHNKTGVDFAGFG